MIEDEFELADLEREAKKIKEEKMKDFLSECIGEVLEKTTIEGVNEYALTNAEVTISKEDADELIKKWTEELKRKMDEIV